MAIGRTVSPGSKECGHELFVKRSEGIEFSGVLRESGKNRKRTKKEKAGRHVNDLLACRSR